TERDRGPVSPRAARKYRGSVHGLRGLREPGETLIAACPWRALSTQHKNVPSGVKDGRWLGHARTELWVSGPPERSSRIRRRRATYPQRARTWKSRPRRRARSSRHPIHRGSGDVG